MKEKKNNHSVESAASSAFWGVCCESGKRYAHVPKKKLHVTMAVLDVTVQQTTDVVSVVMEICGNQHLLCHLSKDKMPQVNLDLLFEPGEKVTFFIKGVGVVHLNGYLIGEELSSIIGTLNDLKTAAMAESSEEDSSDESIESVQPKKALEVASKLIENQKTKQDKSPKVEEAKSPVKSKTSFRCDVCDLTLYNAAQVDSHLKGKRHLKSVKESSGEKTKTVPSEKSKVSPSSGQQKSAMDFSDNSDESDDDFDPDEDDDFDEMSDEEDLSDEEDEDESSDEKDVKIPKDDLKVKGQKIRNSTANAKSTFSMSDDESSSDDSSEDDPKNASVFKTGKRPADNTSGIDKNAKKSKISQVTTNSKEGKKSPSAILKGHTPKPKKTDSDDDLASPQKLSFSETPSKKKKKHKRKSCNGEGTPKTPVKMAGGMEMVDVRTGSGPPANRGKMVHVYYEGTLENGKVFDRCQGKKPFSFKLGAGQVIDGWEKGIEGMRVGGMRKLKIPPALGYKNKSIGDIPANSTLNFVVTLKAVS